MMCAHKTSLMDLRKPLKATNAQLCESLRNLMLAIPGLSDHVEASDEAIKGFHGKTVKTYLVDDVALIAFLYWRKNHGRLPSVLKRCGSDREGER